LSGGDPHGRRLPRGRHPLSAREVEANRRLRLVAAGAALVAERGVSRVTAREIAREAGVSSSTLYELYPGADAVLAAGAELAAVSVSCAVRAACTEEEDDGKKLAAALVAGCEWASQDTSSAALLGLGPAIAVPEIAVTRERLVQGFSDSLGRLRPEQGNGAPPDLEGLMVSASVTLVSERATMMSRDEARGLGRELAELLG
jgi:AcrR family transcriptional regulator